MHGKGLAELGVVVLTCAQMVLDRMLTAAWGRGDDASVSAGSRGGWGVARSSGACWGVVVEKNAVGVHGIASNYVTCTIWSRRSVSRVRGSDQTAEGKQGSTVACSWAASRPPSPCPHVLEKRGERGMMPSRVQVLQLRHAAAQGVEDKGEGAGSREWPEFY